MSSFTTVRQMELEETVDRLRVERDELKAEVERWKLAWIANWKESRAGQLMFFDVSDEAYAEASRVLRGIDLRVDVRHPHRITGSALQVVFEPKSCKECKRPL